MDMTTKGLAHPKPEPRRRTKARTARHDADRIAEVRTYVQGRERGICRCCRIRRGNSMHELRFRSLGGKVTRRNSVWVCGDGTRGCHGLLQSHGIEWWGSDLGADGTIYFRPTTQAACDYLHLEPGKTLASAPMSSYEVNA